MNINKNSWHYRFLKLMDVTIPTNLCPYARKVLFVGLGVGILAFVTGFIVTCMLSFWYWEGKHPMQVIGLAGWFTIVLGLLVAAFAWIWNKVADYRAGRPKVHKEPGLVSSYIKAKHDKICPQLTFTK